MEESSTLSPREQRGLIIAATCKIKQKGLNVWLVQSQQGTGKYTVIPDEKNPHCTCLDHETRGVKCKHLYAVDYVIKREENKDGSTTVSETVTLTATVKKTYPQNWRAYNAAQTSEKATFQVLLRDLCRGIVEKPAAKTGRPPVPLDAAIFSAIFKVYSTVSCRRFMSDLNDAHEKGYVRRVPCYNAIFKVFESEDTSAVLQSLVEESAAPLKSLESSFACDSSGFSGCRFDRWYDHKFKERIIQRSWVKAHIMTGVKTNIVTAVEIHGPRTGDSTMLAPLFKTTAERFTIKELSADMAYSTNEILQTVTNAGAVPYIPFKKNAVATSGGLWAKLFHFFQLNREEFDSRYHLRSNVESTFSMVKAKFGDSVRSKCDVAMKNEVLAKLVCHNICCLIQSMHEFGVDPSFWAESSVAHKVPAL